jgi:monofunctional biosynthetic peptidoglycan transglycosylase
MRQRDGEAREAGRKPRRLQTTVPLRSISKNLIHAVLSAEDPNFFGHQGIDWDAVAESIETNIEKGRYARGGSTITQQLAKNLFFTTHKSLIRKAREAIVVYWMEHDLQKKRIIEIYLNVIEWGDGVYGCEAAARRYYRTSCASLDADQAAGLAAMIPSPRRINPRVNPGLHARATRKVLRQMRWAGYLKRDLRDIGNVPERIVVDEDAPEPREEDTETPTPTATPSPSPEPEAAPSPSPSPSPSPVGAPPGVMGS